jgi:hypothetical protein
MTPAPVRQTDKIARLQELLQEALAIEHSTIPPYLTAWLSVQDGFNREAADVVRSVMLEEMLHLAQVANLLNAVGGKPTLTAKGFVPDYPHTMPYSGASFLVHIAKLSKDGSLDTFLQIEKPALNAPPEPVNFHTIGQFYEAVRDLLREACTELGESNVFTGDAVLQLGPEQYYGSGRLIPVTDLASAEAAVREIVDQGEGAQDSVFDADRAIHGDDGREPAHFYRFNEIKLGRYYLPGDTPSSGPTGPELLLDETNIYNIRPDTKLADYPAGSEIRVKLEHCAATYGSLLKALEEAFNGKPERMKDAIAAMFVLKYEAVALMRTPSGFGDGTTVGLTFEQGA